MSGTLFLLAFFRKNKPIFDVPSFCYLNPECNAAVGFLRQ